MTDSDPEANAGGEVPTAKDFNDYALDDFRAGIEGKDDDEAVPMSAGDVRTLLEIIEEERLALAASEAQRVRVEVEAVKWRERAQTEDAKRQLWYDTAQEAQRLLIDEREKCEAAEQRLREVATNLEAAQRAFRNEMLVTARRLVDDALRAALDGDAAGDSTTDGGVP